MKIDRQIGILSMLLQKDTVTAPYLAEKFEVSRRTINRDIEDLCKAGIPIVTKQGVNGGISIMENYKLDKTLFTWGEMQDILAGLRSLDSVNGTNRYGQLMEKLSAGSSDFMVGNQSVLIDFYMPKNKPEIVKIPPMNYVAVRGKGDPNEEGGAYQQAIGILYAVAYTLKMSYKTDYKIEGFFEYVVPPLEGFWWQNNIKGIDYSNKDTFNWISVIRLPGFITEKDFAWAVQTATEKKKIDCSLAEFLTIDEGLCVQIMHRGSFDSEPATVALMDEFLKEQGYVNDFNEQRLHHEIYMSDARRVAPEKWKTIIRHPIKKV